MVFVVLAIRCGPKTVKDWYGCCVSNTYTLIEVFHDFFAGKIDHTAPIEDENNNFSARVTAAAGKSQDGNFVSCDPECKVGDIVSFLGNYILFTQCSDGPEKVSSTVHDAFNILMSAASKSCHLPEKYSNPANDKFRLQNDIIDWLKEQNVGFLSTNVDTLGKSFVNTLTDSLWYIDGNHHTLEGRGCEIPASLSHFKGYRDPQEKKKRKLNPTFLQEGTLRSHSTAILLLSGNAYLKRDQWKGVQMAIDNFGTCLKKYSDYLNQQKIRSSVSAARVVYTGEKQSWDILNVSPKPIMPGPKARYQSLHTALIHSAEYEPILVNDYAPGEPNRRFDYIRALVVPVKCVKYIYTGAKEHLTFLWKVPTDSSEKDILDKNAKISANLLKTLPKYHTRAMRREFLALFGRSIHIKAAFLREAYRRLTGDCSASLTTAESDVDKRVTETLDSEDSDLIWDLRVNNQGRPEKYLEFLEECQKYISQKVEVAVDDRRHDKIDSEGDVITHLANAFSIRDLHEQVVKQCPPGRRIPSKEWLRYQFWPRNCHFKSSEKYTGKLKIKFMVQSRQFRKTHIDSHYASALFRYEKEFAVQYKDTTSFICMDDKHKVKVGEPGNPVAMVERGKSVLVAMGKRFEVTDHDFTKFSLTPSVNLLVHIPDSVDESFYGGQVYVGIKENCFEPSTPLRHATELQNVLQLENI